jgi:hypothetical protein
MSLIFITKHLKSLHSTKCGSNVNRTVCNVLENVSTYDFCFTFVFLPCLLRHKFVIFLLQSWYRIWFREYIHILHQMLLSNELHIFVLHSSGRNRCIFVLHSSGRNRCILFLQTNSRSYYIRFSSNLPSTAKSVSKECLGEFKLK